jgi:hypothetical protein
LDAEFAHAGEVIRIFIGKSVMTADVMNGDVW